MTTAVPFRRRRNQQRRNLPRRQGRIAGAPWQPLAALVGVAAALWFGAAQLSDDQFVADRFAAERRPNGTGGHGTLRFAGESSLTSLAGRATFTLCAQVNQPSCVIDGDTIRYQGVRIRLADIDAPETRGFECPAEAELGRRATRRLLELMNAGPFELVSVDRDEDRYGRKLRIVKRHGRSVADALVAEGLARRWDGARRGWCE